MRLLGLLPALVLTLSTSLGIAPAEAAASLKFGSISYDSPGADDLSKRSLNAEWVIIQNQSGSKRSLTGWTLASTKGMVYTFGRFALAPGATVRVHTGSGLNSVNHRYAMRSSYALKNGGDRVTLTTPVGGLVASCAWTTRGAGQTACSGAAPPVQAATQGTLSGTIEIPYEVDSYYVPLPPCGGIEEFSAIRVGSEVTVLNAAGRVVATGAVNACKWHSTSSMINLGVGVPNHSYWQSVLSFTVAKVPATADLRLAVGSYKVPLGAVLAPADVTISGCASGDGLCVDDGSESGSGGFGSTCTDPTKLFLPGFGCVPKEAVS